MEYCKQCGMCCRAIVLKYDIGTLKLHASRGCLDSAFILSNWTEITKEDAIGINPYLKEWFKALTGGKEYHFFTCRQFDNNTNRCKIHVIKPKICSDYPFYGRVLLDHRYLFYTPACGYNREALKTIQK